MDIEQLIEELKKRYPEGSPYKRLNELIANNLDIRDELEQLRRNSMAKFRMPGELYLKSIGVLSSEKKGPERQETSSNASGAAPEGTTTDYASKNLYELMSILQRKYPDRILQSTDEIDAELKNALEKTLQGLKFTCLEDMLTFNGFTVRERSEAQMTTAEQYPDPAQKPVTHQNDRTLDHRRMLIEDRRKKLDAFIGELEKRYPGGSTLPTTLWELQRDNKDLPFGSAGTWVKIVYNTTLAAHLREKKLLGDNPIASGHRRGLKDETKPVEPENERKTVQQANERKTVKSKDERQQEREQAERERLEEVVAKLRRKYQGYASERNLTELKSKNPELRIGSLSTLIKRVTGLSPTEYFKKLRLIITVDIFELGIDYETIKKLQNAKISTISDFMQLSPERIEQINGLSAEERIRIQSAIDKTHILYNTEIEELGLSKNVMTMLRNNRLMSAIELLTMPRYLSVAASSKKEINRCISACIGKHYQGIYGDLRLEDVGLPRKILNILSSHGIVYAYEAADGCRDLDGIGQKSAEEIISALAPYGKTQPTFEEEPEETKTEKEQEVVSEEEQQAKAAEALAKKKAEAADALKSFTEKLRMLYPGDWEKESLMIKLRRNNPDLPFEDAAVWCRLVFDKTLKEYLQENGLLLAETNDEGIESAEKQVTIPTQDPEEQSDRPEPAGFRLSSQQSMDTDSTAEICLDTESGEIFRDSVFSEEYIEECVRRDTGKFFEYIERNGLTYSLAEVPGYIRSLHRMELSEYLKRTQSVSYTEYLTVHGIIPGKTAKYWKEQLLQWLRENYPECGAETLAFSETGFAWDTIRNICSIAVPLYTGYDRVSNLQIAEKYSGKLALQPCFCEGNYAWDVALTSNGVMLGQLNRTLFRSMGIGLYLAPLILIGAVNVHNIRLSGNELPSVVFDIRFR